MTVRIVDAVSKELPPRGKEKISDNGGVEDLIEDPISLLSLCKLNIYLFLKISPIRSVSLVLQFLNFCLYLNYTTFKILCSIRCHSTLSPLTILTVST